MSDDIKNWKHAYRSDKALPCPFCGLAPIIVPWHGGGPRKRMVMCRADECGVSPQVSGPTEKRALEAWNAREGHPMSDIADALREIAAITDDNTVGASCLGKLLQIGTIAREALASQPPPAEGGMTHQHVKRGTRYKIVCEGRLQCSTIPMEDMTLMTIYQGEDGQLWVRSTADFNDGRYRALKAAPTETEK